MKDERGVLMVATARGMEPIDRQRFNAGFTAIHAFSRLLGDGLVHAFAKNKVTLKMGDVSRPMHVREGWATYCASGLAHNELPGEDMPLGDVTCVACIAGLSR